MFYSEDLVEQIRQGNDVVDLISSYIKLQKRGSNYIGLCPFHSEKSPSFSVSQSKQMYHCFGCGVGGNNFTFVMEYENYSFIEALRYLANRAGISLPELEYSAEAKQQADIKSSLLEINKEAAKYYYYQLKTPEGKIAYDYLKKRNLSDEIIAKFGLGYSEKVSSNIYYYLKSLGYEDAILKESGLINFDEARGASGKFWNRVMFPIMDVNNRVIGFGGRVMGDGMPKYLNSPETKLFDKSRNLYGLNIARISRKKNILICEGYMDVIALHQAGFVNSVASLGTAFTGLQANLLKRYADEVYIVYDSDGAGTKATLRAIPILKAAGISTKVVDMNPYNDPDDFIKALGAEEFQKRIDVASNSFYYEINVLERSFDLNDPEEKTKFFNEVGKRLLVFTEEIERNNYIEAIANRYHIGFDNLRKLVNRYGAQIILSPIEENEERAYVNKKKYKKLEGIKESQKLLLTWMSSDMKLFSKLKKIIFPTDFVDPLYCNVAQMLYEQYEQMGNVVPAKILNQFESKEEQNEVASLFNATFREEMNLLEQEKALNETVLRIKRYSLDNASKNVKDLEELQKIIQKQGELQKLHISLKDG